MTAHASPVHPTVRCPGCRAQVPDVTGPTHAYIGAAPGCWEAYTVLLGSWYTAAPARHGAPLAVDVYAVQHPGVPGRRSSQSVALHLTALCAVLERGLEPPRVTPLLQRMASVLPRPIYPWLAPPDDPGAVTVLDVVAAPDPAAAGAVVWQWAHGVWDAWAEHHDRARAWLDAAAR